MTILRHNDLTLALLHPLSDGIPDALKEAPAARALPQLMSRIAKARTALVILVDGKPKQPFTAEGRAAILGPHGLVGYFSRYDGRNDEKLTREDPVRVISDIFRKPRRREADRIGFANSSYHIVGDDALCAAARAMAAGFVRELDPDVLSALRFARQLDAAAYNWTLVSKERRIAALRSYAWLARDIMQQPEIAATIDVGGGSLEEALAEIAGWSRRSLKRVSRRPACLERHLSHRTMHLSYRHSHIVDHWLNETPDHLLPDSIVEWRDWADCWNAVKAIRAKLPQDALTRIFVDTYGRKNWRATLDAAIARRHADATNETKEALQLNTAVADVDNALEHLLENVLIPAAIGTGTGARRMLTQLNTVRGEALAALYQVIAGRGGLAPLLLISSQWHRRGDREQRLSIAERQKIPDETRMGSISDEPIVIDTLTFEPKVTAGAIRAEAKTMNNCLYSYVDRAAVGSILVFHVSGIWADEEIEASMTLRPDASTGKLVVDDIRDRRDQRFAKGTEIAKMLADWANASDRKVIVDPKIARTLNLAKGLEGMFNMPELGVERAESSWQSWCHLLPKRLRTASVTEALEGPFFEVGRRLCNRHWLPEKRKSRRALSRRRGAGQLDLIAA